MPCAGSVPGAPPFSDHHTAVRRASNSGASTTTASRLTRTLSPDFYSTGFPDGFVPVKPAKPLLVDVQIVDLECSVCI